MAGSPRVSSTDCVSEELLTLTEAANKLGVPFAALLRATVLLRIAPDFTRSTGSGRQFLWRTERLPELLNAVEKTRGISGPLPIPTFLHEK